jgi:hypothetical protein
MPGSGGTSARVSAWQRKEEQANGHFAPECT